MPAPTAKLNSEPADPAEREKKQLPAKSYADAVDTSVNVGGKEDSMSVKRPEIDRLESSHEYSAEVRVRNMVIVYGLSNSKQGIDDTPRTPTRQKHRKAASKGTNGSDAKGPKEPKINGVSKVAMQQIHPCF